MSSKSKQSLNPIKKLVKSFRSQGSSSRDREQGTDHGSTSSISSSARSYDEGDELEREALRHEALATQHPLLPHLLSAVHDYQLTHGSLIKLVDHPSIVHLPLQHTVLARPIGVSLLPTVWPRKRFDEAWDLQQLLQELFAKVACDVEFLYDVCKDCIADDDEQEEGSDGIITALWRVYEAVRDENVNGVGGVQDIEMGLCRGDWMLHVDHTDDSQQENPVKGTTDNDDGEHPILKQVEFNAVATAGISHSNVVSDMHVHLQRTGIYSSLATGPKAQPLEHHTSTPTNTTNSLSALPTNPYLPSSNAIHGFAASLSHAHRLYGPPRSASASQTAVLMVVQHANVNIADERPIEYALWNMNVPCFRVEYRDVLERTWYANKSDGSSAAHAHTTGRDLIYSPFAAPPSHPSYTPQPHSAGNVYEISVIYLRSSLSAAELLPGTPAQTRFHLERASAIKCPSVLGQLAASKKVQLALSRPGVLEKFLSEEEAESLRRRNMRMWGLEKGSEGRKAIEAAEDHTVRESTAHISPTGRVKLQNTILKPVSAEGGGHNIFPLPTTSTIRDYYHEHIKPVGAQAGYMLMERINPPLVNGALISQRGVHIGPVVQELGVLGGIIYQRGPQRWPQVPDISERGDLGVRHDTLRHDALKHDALRNNIPKTDMLSGDANKSNLNILHNEIHGTTLKSKPPSVNEMSVIKGFGCFDTPCLVEWGEYGGYTVHGG